MRLVLWLWFLLFSSLVWSSWSLSSDGVALLAVPKSLMLRSSTVSTWRASDATPCKWKGVLCDGMNHVISLNLSSSGVSGSLGPQIGLLNYLQVLDLSSNNISGSIPPELGNCGMLEQLDLSQNLLAGKIPASMGNLKKLSSLSVYNNSLNGTIPEELFRNQFLEQVYLHENQLSGSIPSSVGEMASLKSLEAGHWIHGEWRGGDSYVLLHHAHLKGNGRKKMEWMSLTVVKYLSMYGKEK